MLNTQHINDELVSTGMLDHIIVETGGVKMPLSRIALVSVLDPKTLSVNPYDPEVLYLTSLSILAICKVLSKQALLLNIT
jgi:ribosome recycling factor